MQLPRFTVDKAKAFASIFGGESPAEFFEAKTNDLKRLNNVLYENGISYSNDCRMPINTVSAEQLEHLLQFMVVNYQLKQKLLKARQVSIYSSR